MGATVLMAGGHLVGMPAIGASVVLGVAAAGFIAGIPHGAVDHLVAMRLSGGRSTVCVIVAYAGVAGAAWVLLKWAGPLPLLAVVALSALHFGLGELEVLRQLTGWRPGRVPALAIAIAGAGALTVPLARSGYQVSEVAAAVSPGLAPVIAAPPVQSGLIVAWLVAACVAMTASLAAGHPTVALDVALIGALGMIAPPLVAFAVWFGGWHAVRHSARMLTAEPGCAALLATGRWRAATLRLVRLAALPSVAAFSTVAVLGWFALAAPDPTFVVAEVLRLLLALTVPHMMIVLWLDRAANRDA